MPAFLELCCVFAVFFCVFVFVCLRVVLLVLWLDAGCPIGQVPLTDLHYHPFLPICHYM